MISPFARRLPVGTRPAARLKNGWRTLWRLLPYWRPQWPLLVVVVVCSSVCVASTVLAPVVVGHTVDGCIAAPSGGVPSLLVKNLALLAAMYVAGLLAGWAQDLAMSAASQRVVSSLRRQMMSHLLSLDVAFFDSHPRGYVISRFTSDVDQIRDGMGLTLLQMLSTVVTIFAMSLTMLSLSWQLTLATCLSVPLVVFFSRRVIRRSHLLFSRQQAASGRLTSIVEEGVSGIKTIRSLNPDATRPDSFAAANDELRSVGAKAQMNSGVLMPTLRLLDNFSYMLVATIGGLMALSGAVSVGLIQSFLLYTRQFLRPVNMAATQVNAIQSALAGAERIFEMLDYRPTAPAQTAAPAPRRVVRGDVVFDDVSFTYPSGRKALSHVSLHARPGQLVAIVGSTGAGKSTLVNLLMRFYDADDGHILIDGVDVRCFSVNELRRSMAVVLQEPTLFSESVAYNIWYGDVSRRADADVSESARLAMAATFVESLPGGYAEHISDDCTLSTGQRQLISIARAMHSPAPILILDEATSCVDSRTEELLQDALENLSVGRTCIVIAHRLSTVRRADQIVVLADGHVAEVGTHELLLRRKGVYKSLLDSQFAQD
ncbi:MAG: ABC transporter ATP-binding protein [Bacteroidales bacterium]|nr:ABC transporter ATP-binding protein [Bacteroidales bacterium]